MIPKIIHYCWFGKNKKPELIENCINSWAKMEGYKIIEWNEGNCNFNENEYLESAYNNKQWAFVSDYIRLKVLYEYEGIYLDTDVEIKKQFKDEFLNSEMFISFMFNCNISTAIIGCKPKNKNIKRILDLYENKKVEIVPNNDLFTKYFLDNYSEFKLNNKYQNIRNEFIIYPKEYFECPSLRKDAGYSVHHFKGSWRKEKNRFKKYVKSVLGEYIYQNIIRYIAIKKSPFFEVYNSHR